MSKPSKKVLVVYAGGTIGMVGSELGYRPDGGFTGVLQQALVEHGAQGVEVVALASLMDSSNAGVGDWQAMIEALEDYAKSYSALVLLHGTDTLAYTAAALALWFEGRDCALVITGAQRAFVANDSDALENVLGAIAYAQRADFQQVAVYFGGLLLNPYAVRKVHAQDDRAFATPNAPILGEGCALFNEAIGQMPRLPLGEARCLSMVGQGAVALCHITPSMPEAVISACFSESVQAVVLCSYGVGNVPQREDLQQGMAKLLARGGLVLHCTQCFQGYTQQNVYATGVGALGGIEGGLMHYELAYVLAYFACAFNWQAQEVADWVVHYNRILRNAGK